MTNKGFVTNCYLCSRSDSGPLFTVTADDVVIAMLDRYLIAPLELFSKEELERLYKLAWEKDQQAKKQP